jgi:hypothetical protein
MADHRAFFALLEGERNDESIAAVLREGSEVYVEDTRTLVLEAQREGLIPDDHDAGLLALGILGAVSHYSLYLRTGRIDLGVDELARFAGDWVVRSVGGEVPVGDSSH